SPSRLAPVEESALDYSRLAEVTRAVVTTLDIEEALTRLVRLVVPWFADICIGELADDGHLHVVAAAEHRGSSTRTIPPSRLVEPDGDIPPDAGPRWAGWLRDQGAVDVATVPLAARDRLLGALTVASRSGPLGERERDLAQEVARRGSIAAENARLYAEQRDVAERLERALLGDLPSVDGLELCARYRAAGSGAEVGGDWYDAFSLPNGDVALVIGDVVGHDIDAAAVMSQLRTL